MFYGCTNLAGSKGTTYMSYHTNIEFAKTDKGTSSPGYFSTTHSLREPSEYGKTMEDENFTSIFRGSDNYSGFSDDKLSTVKKVEFKYADVSEIEEDENNIDISYSNDGSIFACYDNNVITVKSEGTIYSRQKSLVSMFNWEDSILTTVDFGKGQFDTVAADSAYSMFYGCTNLKYVDMSVINASNLLSTASMFKYAGTEATETDGACVDFVGLKDENDIFSWTTMFNTVSVKDMSEMFRGANVHSSWPGVDNVPLNLISFNVENVINMSYMFDNFKGGPIKFPTDQASFGTKEACSYQHMFSNTTLTYLDLSGFAIADQSKVDFMFQNSKDLERIYVGADFDETNAWRDSKRVTSNGMFLDCESLKGDHGTTYDPYRSNDLQYAAPDSLDG